MDNAVYFSQFWKSKIKVPAWLGFGEGPLQGCRLQTSCILTRRKELGSSLASASKGTSPVL